MPAFEPLTSSAVTTGAQKTVDVDTRRVGRITVIWRLLGTVTAADLTLNDVLPFVQPTDAAPLSIALPAVTNVAPAVAGSDIAAIKQYDVSGIERIRVRAQNNNAGTLNLTIDVFESIGT